MTPVYDQQTGQLRELRADEDGNGRVDTQVYMDGTRVIRAEIDRDEDGRVERWEHYDPTGDLESVALSAPGDGVPDTWVHRAGDGTVSRIERSLRHDGRISRTEFYGNGVLRRVEQDTNGDARVDRWEEYADGVLVSVSFATEGGDGAVVNVFYGSDGETVRIVSREGQTDGSR